MAYSGTVGQTVVSVQDLIDHGARRSGKLAEELTSEQVYAAKQSLFFLLSNLSNLGILYWAIESKIYGLTPDTAIYELPIGSIDVLNANYRTLNRPTPNSTGGYTASSGVAANAFDSSLTTACVQSAADGNIAVNYGTDNALYAGTLGVLPNVSGEFHIIFETSTDGTTWSTLVDAGVTTWVSGTWLWYNIVDGATAQYYRMRETGGATLNVTEFFIGNNSTEVPMARLNRDDFVSLPNKNFTANQPYQFWFNRTIPNAQINLWPTPNDAFVQIVVWYSRQIMDVGSLSGQLEIPDRWYMAIQNMLAHQMSLELPGVPLERITYLEGQADKYLMIAQSEERDKSPVYFAPNIAVYTR
jgi:hypothetical protein